MFMLLGALVTFGIVKSEKKDGLIVSAMESGWQTPEKVSVIVGSGLFETHFPNWNQLLFSITKGTVTLKNIYLRILNQEGT